MTPDLTELYREVVIDHSRRPRHFHPMDDADAQAQGVNPFCGDRVTIYIKRTGDVLSDISFQGTGCAICTASASLMTQTARGRTLEDAQRLFDWFHHLLTSDKPVVQVPDEQAEQLSALSGVRQFPIRVKCATLAWHALKAAMNQDAATVSTETIEPAK